MIRARTVFLGLFSLSSCGCLSCFDTPRTPDQVAAANRHYEFSRGGIGAVSGTTPRADEPVGFHPNGDGSALVVRARP